MLRKPTYPKKVKITVPLRITINTHHKFNRQLKGKEKFKTWVKDTEKHTDIYIDTLFA